MVLRVCRGVLRNSHDAEDAFQATFLVLARKAGSIRGGDSLASWLYGVAYNVAASARSDAARRRSHESKASESRPRAGAGGDWDDLGSVVHEELGRLPERYRAVVVLCCLEGLTQPQAAQQLGWPLGTVQSRLARGRERLRVRLTRRGVAPSAAPALFSANVARAAVPAALTGSATGIAMASGQARASAAGVIPVAVATLAKGVVRSMFLTRLKATGVAMLLVSAVIATVAAVYAHQKDGPGPDATRAGGAAQRGEAADARAHAGLLTITGTVLMPDGTPAAGATVASATGPGDPANVARTDDAGRFQLRGLFGDGGQLHVKTADERHQTSLFVPSGDARTAFASPVKLTLSPSLTRGVIVLSEGRPVAGAQVVASGNPCFNVQGVTGRDGKLQLRLPANGRIDKLVAWHPDLGVNGGVGLESRPPEDPTLLSLLPPGPHEIRVVDDEGKPIGGLELGVAVATADSDGIDAGEIEAARVRTDAGGSAIVPWAPREKLRAVEVAIVDADWKLDGIESGRTAAGITTVRARRRVAAVQGRLVMPAGEDAEGILVTGFGLGPGRNGDVPRARARRDGTFTIRVPAEHAYALGVSDLKWASDTWSGMILGEGASKPAEITMDVYPATPVTARVTRGPRREPVADAWVEVSSPRVFHWTDARGERRSAMGGVSGWMTTDADGEARTGVGKGEQRLRLVSGTWEEEQTIQVTSDKPVEMEFHRP